MADARDRETRKADTLAMLATQAIDVWVATASAAGAPYLVPVSLAWVDERVVIAVEASSVTARNLTASGEARLAVGDRKSTRLNSSHANISYAVFCLKKTQTGMSWPLA